MAPSFELEVQIISTLTVVAADLLKRSRWDNSFLLPNLEWHVGPHMEKENAQSSLEDRDRA